MSSLLHLLTTVLNLFVLVMVLWLALAVYRLVVRGRLPGSGDPELLAALHKHSSKWSSRRVGVAYLDLSATPTSRMAFMGADENTPFEIGSVTKCLTALLVSDAVERGEVALDEPLAALDPRLTGPLGHRTLAHLVTHTSGLPPVASGAAWRSFGSSFLGLNPYPRKGPDMVATAARQRLRHADSTAAPQSYSNLGAALAGQVVAAHAGSDYHELLRARVLDPLNLQQTFTDPAHHQVKRGWTAVGRGAFPWVMDGYSPAGGAVSTVGDMSRFAEALLTRMTASDQTRPGRRQRTRRGGASTSHGQNEPTTPDADSLMPGAVRLATTPVGEVATGTPHREQAVFFLVDTVVDTGRRMVWHNGQTGGYSAFLGVFPEARRAIVVLSDTAAAPVTEKMAMAITRTMVAGG